MAPGAVLDIHDDDDDDASLITPPCLVRRG